MSSVVDKITGFVDTLAESDDLSKEYDKFNLTKHIIVKIAEFNSGILDENIKTCEIMKDIYSLEDKYAGSKKASTIACKVSEYASRLRCVEEFKSTLADECDITLDTHGDAFVEDVLGLINKYYTLENG